MNSKKNRSVMISTKNLYLLEVYKCTDVEMLNGHGLKRYTEYLREYMF